MSALSEFKEVTKSQKDSLEAFQTVFRDIVSGEIYRAMLEGNISKSELAHKMKVSKPAITKLLSGDRNLTINKLTEIAKHLNVEPRFTLVHKNQPYFTVYGIIKNQIETKTITIQHEDMTLTHESKQESNQAEIWAQYNN
ncbi:MAG: helix-turn-helix domain-containing protein [Deltaproteobacteria bacterium]|nr:helix-turn-helix domain-containing protein [Deltaproteobacteria bacterium]